MTRRIFVLLCLLFALATPVSAQVTGPWARVIFGSDTGPTIRSGAGTPEGVVSATEGSLYLQTDGGAGFTLWTKVGSGNTGWSTVSGGGGGSATHNLLTPTHPDTNTSAVVRGAIITGNATPKWARIIPSAAGQFPRFDGLDTTWSLDGSLFTNLNAASLATGTVDNARLDPSVSLLGATIGTAELEDDAITFAKIGPNGCTTNQIAKFNGTEWACAADNAGVGGGAPEHEVLSATHTDTTPGTLVTGDLLSVQSGLLDRLPVGTAGQVLTVTAGAPAWEDPVGATGPIIATDLTMSTARLLGRTSASAGAIEEVTVGSGLTLAAGNLTASGAPPGGSAGNIQTNSGAGGFSAFAGSTCPAGEAATAISASGALTCEEVEGGGGGGSGTITRSFGITIDGAGSVITTGVKGFMVVPYSGTITRVTALSTDAAVTSGSMVMDIWKDTYANYAPTDADSITAAAPVTISSATKSQNTTLTGWNTTVTAGEIVGFSVDSATTLTRATVVIEVAETVAGGGSSGGGSVGDWKLLETHTASSSSTLEFTNWYNATDYSQYFISATGLFTSGDGTAVEMQFSTDGGSTYDTATNYRYGVHYKGSAGSSGLINSGAAGGIQINGGAENTVTTTVANSNIWLFDPVATRVKGVSFTTTRMAIDGNYYEESGFGVWTNVVAAVNALRFRPLAGSGTLAEGTVRIYGLRRTPSAGSSASEFDAGNSGTSLAINWATAKQQIVTMTGNATFTFSGGVAGESYRLLLVQNGTGGNTATWPAGVEFENDTPPVLNTTANKVTMCSFVYTSVGADGYLGFCSTNPISQP